MSETRGPWDELPPTEPPRTPPPAPRPAWHGWAILGALVAFALLVVGLTSLFPGRIASTTDWTYVIRDGGILILVMSSLLARRLSLKAVARNALIWSGLAGVLVLGFTYKDDLAQVLTRVRSGLIPGYATPVGDHEMVISRDASGAFFVVGRVNGQPVNFLVDTGASDIVLSPADARRLGVDTAALTFGEPFETANGIGRGARYTAARLEIGGVKLSKVSVSINREPMSSSLLGMTFFKRLESFTFRGDQLRLTWRDPP